MGLTSIHAKFGQQRPSEVEFRAALAKQLGTSKGLDLFEVEGKMLRLFTNPDSVTRSYTRKVVLDFGGALIDRSTGDINSPALPNYVARPWTDWTWVHRVGIRVRSLAQSIAPKQE